MDTSNGQAAEPRRPNVLLVMCDQLKASGTSLDGNTDARTPHLAALARRGVSFRQAHTPQPLCVPARVSLWTGAYPHDHGSRLNETLLDPSLPSFAHQFAAAGYDLALFGKNHCFGPHGRALFGTWYEVDHHGAVDAPEGRAFREWLATREWSGFPFSTHACPLDPGLCPSAQIADRTLEYLASWRAGGRPFLAWVSFPDPHGPMQAPEAYLRRYPPESLALPPWREGELDDKMERHRVYAQLIGAGEADEAAFRRVLAAYYAMTEFVDDSLGRIADGLDRLGLRDDTIVVFTADHGDFAAEHRLVNKSSALWDCLTRVPLVVSWTGSAGRVPGGRTSDALVSLVDVMPTVSALSGVAAPAISRGVPLPLHGAAPGEGSGARDAVFAEYGVGAPLLTLEQLRSGAGSVDAPSADYASTRRVGPGRRLLLVREAEGRAKMVRTDRWCYVYDPMDAADELYDMAEDPWQLTNLAACTEYATTVAALRRRLLDWSIATEDAHPVAFFFDPETLESTSSPTPAPRTN